METALPGTGIRLCLRSSCGNTCRQHLRGVSSSGWEVRLAANCTHCTHEGRKRRTAHHRTHEGHQRPTWRRRKGPEIELSGAGQKEEEKGSTEMREGERGGERRGRNQVTDSSQSIQLSVPFMLTYIVEGISIYLYHNADFSCPYL